MWGEEIYAKREDWIKPRRKEKDAWAASVITEGLLGHIQKERRDRGNHIRPNKCLVYVTNTKEGWEMRAEAGRGVKDYRAGREWNWQEWTRGVLWGLLTLSPPPCPGMRCLLCPPPLGWLCSWRSLLISSCPTESREWESKTLRHASRSSHCRHLSASTRPEHAGDEEESRQTIERGNKDIWLVLCSNIWQVYINDPLTHRMRCH